MSNNQGEWLLREGHQRTTNPKSTLIPKMIHPDSAHSILHVTYMHVHVIDVGTCRRLGAPENNYILIMPTFAQTIPTLASTTCLWQVGRAVSQTEHTFKLFICVMRLCLCYEQLYLGSALWPPCSQSVPTPAPMHVHTHSVTHTYIHTCIHPCTYRDKQTMAASFSCYHQVDRSKVR